jgi:hypothetical protein
MRPILVLLISVLLSTPAIAQIDQFLGEASDSFFVRFDADTVGCYTPDTATAPLWQIGRTYKSFFTTDTAGVVSVMTDTTHPYPVNANNWFVISFPAQYFTSTVFSFWHRYQTDSGRDGCIVELSQDNGITWFNITDTCTPVPGSGLPTDYELFLDGYYRAGDTLITGESAFSGASSASRLSKFLLKSPPAPKTSANYSCSWIGMDSFFVRFRFVSDSVSDSLAGWFIDSIRVRSYFGAPGSLDEMGAHNQLTIFPNPSSSGIFSFPALRQQEPFTITVTDVLGRVVLRAPHREQIDLRGEPAGLYFYYLTNGRHYYSGKLIYR